MIPWGWDVIATSPGMYQAARGKKQKQHILCRLDAYHGTTYATASLSGKVNDRTTEFNYIEETIHHLTSPNYYRAPEGLTEEQFCDYLIDEMEAKILELDPDNVAAFFAEPILGSGGVIVPPDGYNRRTWELCRKYDILYVADEVVTGFGRLGRWFGSEYYGIQPDIMTIAKGLTSAYLPLSGSMKRRMAEWRRKKLRWWSISRSVISWPGARLSPCRPSVRSCLTVV